MVRNNVKYKTTVGNARPFMKAKEVQAGLHCSITT